MRNFLIVIGVVFLIATCAVGTVVARGCQIVGGVVSEAAAVANNEMGPRALNQKYEWFKNAYASIGAKKAGIRSKQSQIDGLAGEYQGVPRTEWAREDRQAYRQWEQELSGMKLSHNALASEYNAEMSKFHTAFVNAGKLPEGGGDLPREVAEYITD